MEIRGYRNILVYIVSGILFVLLWYFTSRYIAERRYNDCLSAIKRVKAIYDLTAQELEDLQRDYPNVSPPLCYYAGECKNMTCQQCFDFENKIISDNCNIKSFSSVSGTGTNAYYSAKPKHSNCWICVTDYGIKPANYHECKSVPECLFEGTVP